MIRLVRELEIGLSPIGEILKFKWKKRHWWVDRKVEPISLHAVFEIANIFERPQLEAEESGVNKIRTQKDTTTQKKL